MLVSTLNQLGLNETFFIQFVVSIVGLPLVSWLLVKPLFQQKCALDESTVGFRGQVDSLLSSAKEMENQYALQISKAQKEARTKIDGIMSVAQEENRASLTKAREEASKIIESMRKNGEKHLGELQTKLNAQKDALAQEIVERLL